MNSVIKTKLSQKLQVKLHQYLEPFEADLSLPEQKFLKAMSRGILGSGSVIVRQIGQELEESIDLKKTCKRLYENLRRDGLSEKLEQKLLERQCHQLNEDSLILVDASDLKKVSSKQMEGIARVRDGSTGKSCNGYDLLNMIGFNPSESGYQILPLCSVLYSKEKEVDTKANITFDRINDIVVFSNNQGIFVFDRAGDNRINISELSSNEIAYIIRSKGNRGLIIEGKELNFKEVCRIVKLNYELPGKKKGSKLLCGIKRVQVRLAPHPKKNPNTADTWLIVCRHKSKNGKLGGFFYLLCDFPHHGFSEAEIITKALESYRLRWKIEELHRQVKQDYGWEEMQLMSYVGLKNLNTILWIVISFLYSLKKMVLHLAEAFPNLLVDKKKDLSLLFGYVYYRLFKVVRKIFSEMTKYKKITYKGVYHNQLQLKTNFF
ncbi:MAG TPA: hypothetical protein PLD62_08455 [Candidatus Cloacimonadota bacterium]|nr:hypothetical protein [Candidatus Cloacimonadota bacterium]